MNSLSIVLNASSQVMRVHLFSPRSPALFSGYCNIGSNKLLAVFGRKDAKDFIDLCWIFQQTDLTFEDLYRQALEKDTGLSDHYLAYALQAVEKKSVPAHD